MTPVLISLLLVTAGALAGIAVQRARLRRARAAYEDVLRRLRRAEDDSSRMSEAALRIEGSLDAVRAGVVVCDSGGQIVARNPAAETYIEPRYSEALVAGTLRDLLDRALNGESASTSVELQAESRRSYEIEARPIEREGATLGAVALVRDTTERHRTESVRRDFVANVSHELKTPVGALSLLADSLASSAGAEPEVFERLTGRMMVEIQRVSNTIDGLLTLTSLEEQSGPSDEVVDVAAVVASAVDRISASAQQRGVEIAAPGDGADRRPSTEVVAAPGDGADRQDRSESLTPVPLETMTLRGSRVQLESAVLNLLDNAVKFSDAGGRIVVTVDAGPQRLSISVTDDGIGIPAAERSRIFERFYRVDRARSRNTGGTGLGLSIVRHAVLNHGGEVSVTSREGYGTTFTIALPLD